VCGTCDRCEELPACCSLLQRLDADLLCLFLLHALVDALLELEVERLLWVRTLLVVACPSLLCQPPQRRSSYPRTPHKSASSSRAPHNLSSRQHCDCQALPTMSCAKRGGGDAGKMFRGSRQVAVDFRCSSASERARCCGSRHVSCHYPTILETDPLFQLSASARVFGFEDTRAGRGCATSGVCLVSGRLMSCINRDHTLTH
jgi:hypothetical protein